MLRVMLCLLAIFSASPLLALEAAQIAIVYNDSFNGSKTIADAYAKARHIPQERILAIHTSDKEEIDRATFKTEIEAPIKAFVDKQEDVIALVLCRGVPLKIMETDKSDDKGPFDGRDFAAVDSELMTLRLPEHPLTQAFENPFLNKEEPLKAADKVMIVHRLDGPSTEIALGLIDKAILAEAFGAYGQSVLDTGPDKPDYKSRDLDMAKIAGIWSTAKLDFFHDSDPAVYDLSTHPSAPLHYNGWYAGSPAKWKRDFRFRTGAIAVHLHSFSAATLRDVKRNWCAPLLGWGATATIGTVYEPYTVGFPYESIYWDRLCKGYSFGDAGIISNHLLSWQAIFIGDPLYTPYAKDREAAFKERRTILAAMLAAKEDKAEELAKGDQVLLAAQQILRAHVDSIAAKLKKDSATALAEFATLSFMIQDMGINEAVLAGLGDLNKELEKRFKEIKSELKKRINDTEAYENARANWKGLPIYQELEVFHAELVKDQIKEAQEWLKKAKRNEKSNAFEAWFNANQAALCRFAPDESAEGQALADSIDEANRKEKKYLRTPNSKLKSVLSKAKSLVKHKPDEAIELLRQALRDYPACEQRKECSKLLAELRAEPEEPEKKK